MFIGIEIACRSSVSIYKLYLLIQFSQNTITFLIVSKRIDYSYIFQISKSFFTHVLTKARGQYLYLVLITILHITIGIDYSPIAYHPISKLPYFSYITLQSTINVHLAVSWV